MRAAATHLLSHLSAIRLAYLPALSTSSDDFLFHAAGGGTTAFAAALLFSIIWHLRR